MGAAGGKYGACSRFESGDKPSHSRKTSRFRGFAWGTQQQWKIACEGAKSAQAEHHFLAQ